MKDRYPACAGRVYLDAAAVGAQPASALAAGQAMLQDLATRGADAIMAGFELQAVARERAGRLLGAPATQVAFTESTSSSMNLLALLARRDAGDRDQVVLLRDEFPSSTVPWLHHGFEAVWVEPVGGEYPVGRIVEAVGPRTRAVVTSQVQYRTGAVTDVAAVSEAVGCWHIVNATQAAGVVPVQLGGATAVTVTGLKWLGAGLGNGILVLSEELAAGRSPLLGWTGVPDFMAMENARFAGRPEGSAWELGGVGIVRHAILERCLAVLEERGMEAVTRRATGLAGWLRRGLLERGVEVLTPDRHAGIVSAVRTDAGRWHEAAMAAGVIQSQRGPDTIRFSVHHYNDEDDVAGALDAWDGL